LYQNVLSAKHWHNSPSKTSEMLLDDFRTSPFPGRELNLRFNAGGGVLAALKFAQANKRDSLVAEYGELALGLRAIASITTHKISSQAL
jgi:hypothetical protein